MKIYEVTDPKTGRSWHQALCEDHANQEVDAGFTIEPTGYDPNQPCYECREESEYEDFQRLCDSYDRLGETPRSY